MVTHDGGKRQKQLNTRNQIETKSETEKIRLVLCCCVFIALSLCFLCFTFTLAAVWDRVCCFCCYQSSVECRGKRESSGVARVKIYSIYFAWFVIYFDLKIKSFKTFDVKTKKQSPEIWKLNTFALSRESQLLVVSYLIKRRWRVFSWKRRKKKLRNINSRHDADNTSTNR